MNLKYFIFQKIPPRLFVFLRGQGWRGNFKSWSDALRLTTGYDTAIILEKSKMHLLNSIEKQNIPNPHTQYPWELLSTMMWIAAQNKGCFNIIDFGGSLGGTFYQNKIFLDQLESVKWNVIEQPHFIELGKKEFETDILKFYFSVDECLAQNAEMPDCLLFGSVLNNIEKPYDVLADLLSKKINYIFITRTGFLKNNPDRITIQKVPKSWYDASYPCWIFEEQKFMDFFKQYGYELIFDYKEKYQINIPSEYKGCLFKLKEK
jgi:putative methyltransferase (TIGR04325 family)